LFCAAISDHAFEQLFLQNLTRRQRGVLPPQVLHHLVITLGQFLSGNDIVVDDSDDMVDLGYGSAGRKQGRCGNQQHQP
jgi:hypothetical protein